MINEAIKTNSSKKFGSSSCKCQRHFFKHHDFVISANNSTNILKKILNHPETLAQKNMIYDAMKTNSSKEYLKIFGFSCKWQRRFKAC